jgi:hypothetical protein
MVKARKAGAGLLGAAVLALAFGAAAQPLAQLTPWPVRPGQPPAEEADGYTRYELLAPGSGRFRILYDISAVRPGARAFYNPIRKGSVASDERVTDRASGQALSFRVVSGAAARQEGETDADPVTDYIRVELARPVPTGGGQARMRIEKTYADPKSYRMDGAELVFDRPLGIKRNAVVLPQGYVLASCNYPSQVAQEPDGRIRISFLNVTPAEAPLILRARPGRLPVQPSSQATRFEERARQSRDIVYALRQPETHAFDLYHDYTEERAGVDHYVNVVRTGSAAQNPSALNLDTGEAISAHLLKGAEIAAAGVSDPELGEVGPETEVVVFPFRRLEAGQSIRLRMSETYTDPGRYRLIGDELVFDRSFGRAYNAVVLPAGWTVTNSSAPAVVSQTPDGRTRLDFDNPRGDEVEVLITARRTPPPA